MNNYETTLRQMITEMNKPIGITLEEIPEIDLYMDQVTTFIDEKLSGFKRNPKDKILTKTMINNYAKDKLIPAPKKKKYAKNHILLLVMTYHLKNALSIQDIGLLLSPLNKDTEESKKKLAEVYNTFLLQQETVAREFCEQFDFSSIPINSKDEMALILTAMHLILRSNINKRLAEKIIDYFAEEKEKNEKNTKKSN